MENLNKTANNAQEQKLKITNLRKAIVASCKLLSQKQLMAGSWGNVSAKAASTTYAITPSGHGYDDLLDEDIVIINAQGAVLAGNLLPSSEAKLHLAIYQKFPQAGAIVHTHSIYASVLAVLHKTLPPIIEDAVQVIGGSICCAAYALPGTKELAHNVLIALEDNKHAAFLANHGLICWGRDLKEAVLTAELTEKAAKIYCTAQTLGSVQELKAEDVKTMHDFYLQHYSKRQRGEE